MDDKKYIFITGASSGIGRTTAEALAQSGFYVFAGVRSSDAVFTNPRITPIFIDVTSKQDREAAMIKIQNEMADQYLYGLINNAGIASGGATEALSSEEMLPVFQVNFFAIVDIVRLFTPLLTEDSRIINISSVAGLVGFPYIAPYCSSKFALEAYTEALRIEMRRKGIWVTSIQPSVVKTNIFRKGIETLNALEKTNSRHTVVNPNGLRKMKKILGRITDQGMSTTVVSDSILKILCAKQPAPRVLIGRAGKILLLLRFLLPQRIFVALQVRTWKN